MQWNGHRHQRRCHAEQSGRFLTCKRPEYSKHESDEQTTVTQENRRRVEVVSQEAEQAANQRHGDQDQVKILMKQRRQQHGDCGEHADAGR